MKHATLIVRLLLGFIFLGSGISFFFITPPPMEGAIGTFMAGMMATGYMLYLIKGCEILFGLLLMLGLYVPLALVVLAPIILNIFLVHAFMMPPETLVLPLIIGLLEVYLAFFSKEYSPTIKQLFLRRKT